MMKTQNATIILSKFTIVIMIVTLISSGFQTKSSATVRTSNLVAEWERAKAYTLEYLNASTDEMIDFKPTSEMRTFSLQMLHLADNNFGFAALASGKQAPSQFGELEKNASKYRTKAEITKAVTDSYDFVIASLKDFDDKKLDEVIDVLRWKLTREMTYYKAFEHQTHHRGQATVYLRLKGIEPPTEKLF